MKQKQQGYGSNRPLFRPTAKLSTRPDQIIDLRGFLTSEYNKRRKQATRYKGGKRKG
jgi:hypothetical protein